MNQMPSSPDKPSVDSMERSKLPVIKVQLWPMTRTPSTEALNRMLTKLPRLRKLRVVRVKKITIAARRNR